MKILLLMRHAKSSWKDPEMADADRPLNHRGEKDAPRMGKLLKKEELAPDLIISSPAVRARDTAVAVAEKLGYEQEILYNESLYLGEPRDYLTALQTLSDDVETVLVIGHNPGLETLLQILTGDVESLPTGAIAYLKVPVRKWSALTFDMDAHLKELWRPKDLR